MLDPTNLPLSKKKIWKRTIDTVLSNIMEFLVVGLVVIFAVGARFAVVLFGMIIFCIWIYQYYYYKMYYYKFEEENAEIRKGVFSQTTGHVSYDRIQTIFLDQDYLDRLFGLYDVHYETAGEQSEPYSHVDGLIKENADTLIAFLNKKTRQETRNAETQEKKEKTASAPTPSAKRTMPEMEYTRENCQISEKIVVASSLDLANITALLGVMVAVISFQLANLAIAQSMIIKGFVVLYAIIVPCGIIYNKIWYNNFYFKFDNEKGEITSKIIGTSTSYLYYDRIQNISIEQDVVGRIFGLYKLSIETAGDRSKITLCGFEQDNANKLKDFLLAQAKSYRKI